jgi:GTP-binding protein
LGQVHRDDIRNIAIVAHVDHGKTSLVDAMLKQSKVFRDNQQVGQFIMDQNVLEREKGITILAKNTAVTYHGVKINIIDTPGHADFSGEVERVINMADGCLLLVDSVEGPMPQTKFVLRQALVKGLKPIVVINKIDRSSSRIDEVVRATQDLFLELATNADQLDFPVLYASARDGTAVTEPGAEGKDLVPLFECILQQVPPPAIEEGPFQMLVCSLDYDSYKGKIAIGRISRGKVSPHDIVVTINRDGNITQHEVGQVFTYLGLNRLEVEEAQAGDIVAITGLKKVSIGETIASPERLYHELETNIALQVHDTESADVFLVAGRGELHLAILIETMRREGYEFQISKPEAITKVVEGKLLEPVEALTIDTREEYIGVLSEILSNRQAQLTNMNNDGKGNVRMEFRIPTRGLIGFTSAFLTATRGDSIMNTLFLGYEPWYGDIESERNGALVSAADGVAVTYGLNHAQGRGITFIEPGTHVYEGMIVGLNSRAQDVAVNVCKEKKQTNVRSSTADIAIKLTPAVKLSLEQALDFIKEDELVEITPKSIRVRKKLLTQSERLKARHLAQVAEED